MQYAKGKIGGNGTVENAFIFFLGGWQTFKAFLSRLRCHGPLLGLELQVVPRDCIYKHTKWRQRATWKSPRFYLTRKRVLLPF